MIKAFFKLKKALIIYFFDYLLFNHAQLITNPGKGLNRPV